MITTDCPTVLPEHSERSDQLHARRVHGDEDHAVLPVSTNKITNAAFKRSEGLHIFLIRNFIFQYDKSWKPWFILLSFLHKVGCVTLLTKQEQRALHILGVFIFRLSILNN